MAGTVHEGDDCQSMEKAETEVPFLKMLLAVIRANTASGFLKKTDDDELLSGYLGKPRGMNRVAVSCLPDSEVVDRVIWFYSAVAREVERRVGLPTASLFMMSRESFGRVQITVGRLVVARAHIRNVNTFGFSSLSDLVSTAEGILDDAEEWVRRFPDVTKA